MASEEWNREYMAAMHAMQSAVAMLIAMETGLPDGDQVLRALKHQRVGLNGVMAEHAALAGLLIRKGVITEQEYLAAILEGVRAEAKRAAAETRERLGLPETVRFS